MRAFVAAVIATLLLSLPATAADRVALVIGNSLYQHATPLDNPGNDAVDIAARLEGLGFRVHLAQDLTKQGLDSAVRDFTADLPGARVALFYYAGHALQAFGRNYLVPVDARLTSEADLDFEVMDLSLVMRQMEREPRINLVFLDACRDNPLQRNLARSMGASRSASLGTGLAQTQAGIGTLIAYATQPDNVALDGTGRNSPFTEAVLRHIETPGLEIRQLMTRVRNDVIQTTNGRQVPWDNSSLTADVYLAGGEGLPVPQVAALPGVAAPPVPDSPPRAARTNRDLDGRWRLVMESVVEGKPLRIDETVDILGGEFQIDRVLAGQTLNLHFQFDDEILDITSYLTLDRSAQLPQTDFNAIMRQSQQMQQQYQGKSPQEIQRLMQQNNAQIFQRMQQQMQQFNQVQAQDLFYQSTIRAAAPAAPTLTFDSVLLGDKGGQAPMRLTLERLR